MRAKKTPYVAKKPAASGVDRHRILSDFCSAHCFTPREREIFTLICTGEKNASIARALDLSDATIRLHITNLHRKLGTGRKSELVLKVFDWLLANHVAPAKTAGNV